MTNIFSAMSIIEKLYFKILLIHKQKDIFQEIKQDDIPTSQRFSEWWVSFAESGRVHPDDVKKYLEFIINTRAGNIMYYRRLDCGKDWNWAYIEILDYDEEHFIMFIRKNASISQRLAALDTLEYTNYHDTLTRCRNRRAYNAAVSSITHNCFVIYIDLDDLKKYNDNFGHEAGDRYIVACVNCFKNHFRAGDIYRYEEDKFIILTECKKERFLNALGQLPFEFQNAGVRASFGYSYYDGSISLLKVIRQAELAMHEHKQKHK